MAYGAAAPQSAGVTTKTASPRLPKVRPLYRSRAASRTAAGSEPDGTAECWGSDEDRRTSPPSGEFSSISIGGAKSCGIRTEGTVGCWGEGYTDYPTLPPEGQFQAVSVGAATMSAVSVRAAWPCAGERNRDGESSPPGGQVLPDRFPDPIKTGTPPQPPPNLRRRPSLIERYSAIDSGDWHTCGVRSDDREVDCWGSNAYGQASPPEGERFAAVSGGLFHTCGLRSDGSVVCWGAIDFDLGQSSHHHPLSGSSRSAAAESIRAVCAPMARSPAGATTSTGS